MWISGEVIIAQALLTAMGAASVTSVIVCQRGDRAVEQALRKYATFDVVEAGPGRSPRAAPAATARRVSAAAPAGAPKTPPSGQAKLPVRLPVKLPGARPSDVYKRQEQEREGLHGHSLEGRPGGGSCQLARAITPDRTPGRLTAADPPLPLGTGPPDR